MYKATISWLSNIQQEIC